MIADDRLIEQVSEATATSEDGEHLVQMYYPQFIHLEGVLKSVQQASGRLQLGEWVSVVSVCGQADCCRPDHLEEQGLALVASHSQQQAVSLADLYRKGRNRGLLTARTEYGG